jgi:Flp pilus assembly pilin Flp
MSRRGASVFEYGLIFSAVSMALATAVIDVGPGLDVAISHASGIVSRVSEESVSQTVALNAAAADPGNHHLFNTALNSALLPRNNTDNFTVSRMTTSSLGWTEVTWDNPNGTTQWARHVFTFAGDYKEVGTVGPFTSSVTTAERRQTWIDGGDVTVH